MTDDETQAEIDRLTAEIDRLTERRASLRKLLSFPTVTPVLEYFRYGSEYKEPATCAGTLESAALQLAYMVDDGQCSATGVSVGGALLSMNELRERFPKLDDL